jgi:hypothetical protein
MNSNCIKLIGMSCISAILASEPYMSATAAESKDTQPASIKLQPITVYSAVAGDGQLVAPLDILAPLNQESYTQKSIETFGRQGIINVFKVIESYTTGKAGGLKESEPLKAVENQEPPKGDYQNSFSCSRRLSSFSCF